MKNGKIVVGITHGDVNGVGYEVILKIFSEPAMLELCTPIIYGSPKVATYHRKALELTTNFVTIQKADDVVDGRLNLVDCLPEEVKIDFGQATAESGQAALKALERAMADYREGLFDVLVTAPINKASIQGDGFHFPGHTEYIQERVGDGREALMILMNDVLRVALVTTHLPIREVAQAITKEVVMRKIRIFHEALRKDFNVEKPRIAVLALNPHAGDGGLLGAEEQDVIIPAIEEISKEGIICISLCQCFYSFLWLISISQFFRFDKERFQFLVLRNFNSRSLRNFFCRFLNRCISSFRCGGRCFFCRSGLFCFLCSVG